MLFFTLDDCHSTNQEKKPAEKYYKKIFNYCRYHLNNDRSAAAECAQEVFVTYYAQLRNMKTGDPKSWLYHTADNFLNRYIRELAIEKRRFISFEDDKYEESEDVSYEPNFDAFLEKCVSLEGYTEKIISALKDKEQKLYNQYFLNHIPIRDLAEEYNVSEGTMRARIYGVKQHILRNVIRLLESEPFASM